MSSTSLLKDTSKAQEINIDGESGVDLESLRYGSFSSLRTAELLELGSQELDNEVPQGRHLGVFSTVVLFVSRIVGSGIFATPSSIFVNCGGNMVLFFGVWFVAALMAFAGLYLFLEFGCLLPKSGGRKNFLEAVYDRPKLMTSVTFATYTVLTGFSVSNAIVFGKYTLYALGFDEDFVNNRSKACNYIGALLVMTVVFIHGVSVRHGIFLQNFLGALKLLLIAIMSFTGVYALCFYRAEGSQSPELPISANNLHDFSSVSSSSLTTAFIQAFFCFAGWDSVHSVASEIKNPVRTFKIAGPLSLIIALLCYLSLNLAYVRVLSYEEFKNAGPLVGSILFSKLFGQKLGRQFVTLSIALSAGSNLFVVIYSLSRMNQECFREGYLPFSNFMASNKPWGAPLPSLLCCGLITTTWLILLPSSGDAYNYLVSMESYANQFFLLLVAIGLIIYRKRYPERVAEIQASLVGVFGIILLSCYLVVGPFIGEQKENTIHWLPSYQITAILIIAACFCFWLVKFVLLPTIMGYNLKAELIILDDGLVVKQWYAQKNE